MNIKSASSKSSLSPRAAARFWRATLARDPRADGSFVLAVRSTHINCCPSWPAPRPLPRNVLCFNTREEAEKHGFRPCLGCKPNDGSSAVVLVERAAGLLADAGEERLRLKSIAEKLNTTTATLRRAFRQVTKLTPRDLAEALRLERFKKMLRAGTPITEALYETGYGSSRPVYERSNAHLRATPPTHRHGGKGMEIGFTISQSPLARNLSSSPA